MRMTAITAIATAACVVAVTGSRTLGPMGLHHRGHFSRSAHMHGVRMIGISLAESDAPTPLAQTALPTLRATAGVVLRGGLVPIVPEADFDWPPPESQAFGEPPARQLLLGAVAGPAAGPSAAAPASAPSPDETPPSMPNLGAPMPAGGVLAGPQTGPTPPPPPGPPDPGPPNPGPPAPTPPDPGLPAPPPVVLPDQPPPNTLDVPPIAPPPAEQPPPAAVVPEPASWLMMILGLGLVGCALPGRRRQALGARRLGNNLAS